VLIRKALVTDAEQIWAVHSASIREVCSGSYTLEQIDEWIAVLAPGHYLEPIETLEFVVAEVDGQVQGFCILNLDTGELHAVYVAPAACGRGIGRELMTWAENTASRHGWAELFLKATLNAVSFYEKCGFRAGRLSNHPLPSGTPRACVEMRKTL
jgi:N-acetylglutamate synthase-like GNAT family acetyltransferase